MQRNNKFKTRHPYGLRLMVGLFFFGALSIAAHLSAEPLPQISPAEAEDHQLIRHLFEDKRYLFAKEEAQDYLKKYPKGLFRAETVLTLAQIHVAKEEFPKALVRYREVVEDYPSSPVADGALYYSGILLLQLKRNQAGRDSLRELEQQFSQSQYVAKIHYPLGQLAFEEKNWKLAVDRLTAAIHALEIPKLQAHEAKRLLAWSYHFSGDGEQSEKWFLAALELELDKESKAAILYQLGINTQNAGQFSAAIPWFEKQIQLWPHPDFQDKSRFGIAESLYFMHRDPSTDLSVKDQGKAIQLFSKNLSLKKPVQAFTSRYHRGWLYLAQREDKKAEADFAYLQKHSEQYRKDAEVTLIRSEINYNTGQWPTFLAVMTQVFVLMPEKKSDFLFLIRMAKANDQLSDPKIHRNWKSKSSRLKKTSDYRHQATLYYESAYHRVPKGDDEMRLSLSSILANRYQTQKKYQKAVTLYQEVVTDLAPGKKKTALSLRIAKIYAQELKNDPAARKWFYKLHQKGNTAYHYEASYAVANLEVKRKRLNTAIKVLKELSTQPIKNTKWFLPVRFRLGTLYQAQEKWKKARNQYRVIVNSKLKSKLKKQAGDRIAQIDAYLKTLAAQN